MTCASLVGGGKPQAVHAGKIGAGTEVDGWENVRRRSQLTPGNMLFPRANSFAQVCYPRRCQYEVFSSTSSSPWSIRAGQSNPKIRGVAGITENKVGTPLASLFTAPCAELTEGQSTLQRFLLFLLDGG